MPKFEGFLISAPVRFDLKENGQPVIGDDGLKVPGAGAAWVRLTKQNGEPLVDMTTGESFSIVVDLKAGKTTYDRLMAAGLGKGANVEFEADGWVEHQPGVDRVLEARGDYPATNIHRIAGLKVDSIAVKRWAKVSTLETMAAAADAALKAVQQKLNKAGKVKATAKRS